MPTLKDKVSKKKVNWPDLVFAAEANKEWFEEVTVVTLKSHYYAKAYEAAWSQINNPDKLDETAQDIMASGSIKVQEYIKISNNLDVEICLDREKISDSVVEEALNILMDVEILPNIHIKLGDEKTFQPHDVWQSFSAAGENKSFTPSYLV